MELEPATRDYSSRNPQASQPRVLLTTLTLAFTTLFPIPRASIRRRRCASTTPAIRISGFSLPDPPPLRPRTSRRSCLSVTGCGCQARPFHPRHPPPCLGIRGLKVAAGSCPVCSTWNECFRAWERAERRRELVAHVLFAAPQTYNFG
jgi:hypothetical protein